MIETKIKTLAQLKRLIINLKNSGKKIVFTNGCFDILHFGHVKYLEEAKSEGDILIVAVNSNWSVKKIKGNHRPIIDELDRARVIAALESVDYVIIFNELNPHKLIEKLKPDILVKGGDWKIEEIVGKDLVSSYKGKVVSAPYIEGHSTRSVISAIVNKFS